jgi:hypothetical protein
MRVAEYCTSSLEEIGRRPTAGNANGLIEMCDLSAEHPPEASNCSFFDLGQITRVHCIVSPLFGFRH